MWSFHGDTLGFLWLHRDSPPYLLHLLVKFVDGLSDDRMRPLRSTTTTITTIEEVVIGINRSFNMEPATATVV